MTKLTEEERQRLCVAKFRDMSDELLSEMPGTVMELAQKYVRTKDKFDKTSGFLMKALEFAPIDFTKHIATSVLADMVVHGEREFGEVMKELEAMSTKKEST